MLPDLLTRKGASMAEQIDALVLSARFDNAELAGNALYELFDRHSSISASLPITLRICAF